MKKLSTSRLALSRETVRGLEGGLASVVGGITNITCPNSCDTAINSFCYTCAKTGGC
jgi:hypothetical protein